MWATPAKEYTANTIAVALFTYFCTFGMFEELWSDPGSDLMSEVVQKLCDWMGIRRVISLVDRHESNGGRNQHTDIASSTYTCARSQDTQEVVRSHYLVPRSVLYQRCR